MHVEGTRQPCSLGMENSTCLAVLRTTSWTNPLVGVAKYSAVKPLNQDALTWGYLDNQDTFGRLAVPNTLFVYIQGVWDCLTSSKPDVHVIYPLKSVIHVYIVACINQRMYVHVCTCDTCMYCSLYQIKGGGSSEERKSCRTLSAGVVTGLLGVPASQVAMGRSHTAVLTQHGTVYTFGNNSFGQCGRNYKPPKEKGDHTCIIISRWLRCS